MSETRERIRRRIRKRPGIHFSELLRELDIATGQGQYHLHRLTRSGEVTAEEVGGKTHYFDPTFDPWERRAVAYLRRETPRGIIARLHANGPMHPDELAEELDLARSTIAWHVSNLVEDDVVEKSSGRPVTVSLCYPDQTADLLEEVSPSLPDSIVDRFVRTVDKLLE